MLKKSSELASKTSALYSQYLLALKGELFNAINNPNPTSKDVEIALMNSGFGLMLAAQDNLRDSIFSTIEMLTSVAVKNSGKTLSEAKLTKIKDHTYWLADHTAVELAKKINSDLERVFKWHRHFLIRVSWLTQDGNHSTRSAAIKVEKDLNDQLNLSHQDKIGREINAVRFANLLLSQLYLDTYNLTYLSALRASGVRNAKFNYRGEEIKFAIADYDVTVAKYLHPQSDRYVYH